MLRTTMGRIALLFMASLLAQARTQEPKATAAEVMTWTEGSPRPNATLEVARWLEGSWEGMLESAMQQHTVFAPVSGQMPSFVRAWGPDGTIWFYEIGVLAEVDGSLEFRVKHCTSELAGWEDKDGFVRHRLVAVTDRALYFDGITYVKEGPDRHTVYVRNSSGEHQEQIVVVHQKRVNRATAVRKGATWISKPRALVAMTGAPRTATSVCRRAFATCRPRIEGPTRLGFIPRSRYSVGTHVSRCNGPPRQPCLVV